MHKLAAVVSQRSTVFTFESREIDLELIVWNNYCTHKQPAGINCELA